ncbi:hypothetical protein [Nostoc sp. DedSLP04]|nr:hypothetical protein [Nostoc sp. DedSLP04]MDZ8033049.1 hypothetical protein [Nostoc sp. DedSLP04]
MLSKVTIVVIGHWALGIGHWTLGIGHLLLSEVVRVASRREVLVIGH